ncbi:MAG: hypothetical protein QMC83_02745 [Thermodesulfovibrionales bacterium]|nr:hypothetical protein [Thermodesulfovibrionales bacterium]
MSRYFKVLVLAILAVGLMAGSAYGLKNIQRQGNVDTTTIAKEIIDPSVGYTHVGAGAIEFDISSGIANGKKIVFTLTNGTLTNINSLKMCTSAHAAVTANLTSTTTDKRRAEFTATGAIAAGPDYYLTDVACGAAQGLSIGIDANASAVTVTIATDDTNEATPQLSNTTFYKAQQQFGLNDCGSIIDTIDVEADLLKFLAATTASGSDTVSHWEGGNGLATGFKAASSGPTLAAVAYPNVNVNFKVSGNLVGLSSVILVDTKGTPGTGDDVDIATLSINADKTEATGSMKLMDLTAKTVAIKLTVDGSTTLEDRKLSIGATLSTADDVKVSTTLIDSTATTNTLISGAVYIVAGKERVIWDLNGLQFVAPYVRQDSIVTSVIRAENASNKDSKIWWFVNNGGIWKLVKTDNFTNGSVLLKTGQALIDDAAAAGVTLDATKGFSVWGVVKTTDEGNRKNITVYGSQQLLGGPFRPLPVQVKWADWHE